MLTHMMIMDVNCFNSFQSIRTLKFKLVSLFEWEMLMYDKGYCKNIALL